MTQQPKHIVGAGLAGLLAAHAWPNIPIIEAVSERSAHKALLRFRSDAVSKMTGIPFRKVTVRKGIWFRGEYRAPAINYANQYSRKVIGRVISDRSIWNVEPVERFIAPESFYEQLIDFAGKRIEWGRGFDFKNEVGPIISTAPLPVVIAEIIGREAKDEFIKAPIRVERYRMPAADVFQTVYFPDLSLPIYRASMTGSLLIIESTADSPGHEDNVMREVGAAFGFKVKHAEKIDDVDQQYGKIVPLADELRKHLLFKLTNSRGIYSLGRFAQWRNILLDDVVDDIAVIKRLLQSASPYDAARQRAG